MSDSVFAVLTVIVPLMAAALFQLLLCFKVKSRLVRLLPVCLLSAAAAFQLLMACLSGGMAVLGFEVMAVFSGLLLLACGAGWLIWAAATRRKRLCFLVLSITFALLTLVGVGFVLSTHGSAGAGYAVVPMGCTLVLLGLYQRCGK